MLDPKEKEFTDYINDLKSDATRSNYTRTLDQFISWTQTLDKKNQFYYSFSPTIADYERQNPVFKEAVKITITPLISSLSLLNFVQMDSEFDVLGYGISLIMLNVGMYFVAPVVVIHRIKKILNS